MLSSEFWFILTIDMFLPLILLLENQKCVLFVMTIIDHTLSILIEQEGICDIADRVALGTLKSLLLFHSRRPPVFPTPLGSSFLWGTANQSFILT